MKGSQGIILLLLLLLFVMNSKKQQGIQNEETWNWVDYKGNSRSITVHRNVQSTDK